MRLIDADALRDALLEENYECHQYCYPCKTIIKAIDAASTVQPERQTCKTCKHFPPEKKWPCVDCDMREPADRWER